MHKHAISVPKFKMTHGVKKCPTCIKSKLKKSPIRHGKIRKATQVGQGLSLDWGFVTASNNEQVESLTGSMARQLSLS